MWLSLSVKHLKQTEEWKISLWKIQVNLFQAKFSEHILDTKNRGSGIEKRSMEEEHIFQQGCEISECKKSPIMLIS